MIKKVTVTNEKNESLELDLFHPEEHGIYIKSITGLGPGKANINVNSLYTVDGGIFASARKDTRNIVFNLGFMFTDKINNIEEIRLFVYKYFNIKKKVKLTFVTDSRTSEIEGYVESNEPDIFSQQETAQISIICPDPWFHISSEKEYAFFGANGMFEFPFSNESLDEPLIEFGEIRTDSRTSFYYKGEIDTGFTINIFFKQKNIENTITIINTVTLEKMIIYPQKIRKLTNKSIAVGDSIIISTNSGNKYANFMKNGKNYNVASIIDKDSDWLKLSYGDNRLAYICEDHEKDIFITFIYQSKFSGV